MTILHREGNIHKSSDGLSRWSLENLPYNHAWDGQLAGKIMCIFPLKNDLNNPEFDDSEGTINIHAVHVKEMEEEFWDEIRKSYESDKNVTTIVEILQSKHKNNDLINSLEEP